MRGLDREILDGNRSPAEFESYVLSLIKKSGEYQEVAEETLVSHGIFDGTAMRTESGAKQKIVFEIKYRNKDRRLTVHDIADAFVFFQGFNKRFWTFECKLGYRDEYFPYSGYEGIL